MTSVKADKAEREFPIITLCGSMRFYSAMLDYARHLTSEGNIVLMPHAYKRNVSPETGVMLDAMHRVKISMSHELHMVTDRTGYFGSSTSSEIEYALALKIPIRSASYEFGVTTRRFEWIVAEW